MAETIKDLKPSVVVQRFVACKTSLRQACLPDYNRYMFMVVGISINSTAGLAMTAVVGSR